MSFLKINKNIHHMMKNRKVKTLEWLSCNIPHGLYALLLTETQGRFLLFINPKIIPKRSIKSINKGLNYKRK